MKNLFYFLFAICILVCSQNKAVQAEVIMGADLNDGYAGNVLDVISKRWQSPNDNVQRNVRIRIQISGKGELLSCSALSSIGIPAIDKSICDAARSVAKYGIPPYGMPLEVYLSVKTGSFGNKAKSKTLDGNKNLGNKQLNNASAQSASNLAASNVSNSSIKKSNNTANVLPASSSIPAPLAKEKVTKKVVANDELSYDDWDGLEDSLNNNVALPVQSAKAGNMQGQRTPQRNMQTYDAPQGNRSTYTVANRPPPSGGRIVAGVWIPAGQGNNNVSPSQGSINSGQTSSHQPAIPPQNTNDLNVSLSQNPVDVDVTSSINPEEADLTSSMDADSIALSPPRNAGSTALTPPTRNIESRSLDTDKSVLNTDNVYTQTVMQKIAQYIRVPDNMPNGRHTVEMVVEIGNNGVVGDVIVKKISGTHDMEKSVIDAIKNIKDIPAPPNNKTTSLEINFIVEKV